MPFCWLKGLNFHKLEHWVICLQCGKVILFCCADRSNFSPRYQRYILVSLSAMSEIKMSGKELIQGNCGLRNNFPINTSFDCIFVEPAHAANDHGLSPLELQHKKDEVKKCKERGVTPSLCKKCGQETVYMYNSFFKRGGTKYLYCCENCFHRSSKLVVSEDDYDFLSN